MVRSTPASWASTTGLVGRASPPVEAQEAARRARRGRWRRTMTFCIGRFRLTLEPRCPGGVPGASRGGAHAPAAAPRPERLFHRPDEGPPGGNLEGLARGLVGMAGVDT